METSLIEVLKLLEKRFFIKFEGMRVCMFAHFPFWILGAVRIRGVSRTVFLNPFLNKPFFKTLKKRVFQHECIHLYRQEVLGSSFFEESLTRFVLRAFPWRVYALFFYSYLVAIITGSYLFSQDTVIWVFQWLVFIGILPFYWQFSSLSRLEKKLEKLVGNKAKALILRLTQEEVKLFLSLSSIHIKELATNWSCHKLRWKGIVSEFFEVY